ncbi:ATP phosphoribosyltransferase regulatory subunit [Novosphingobium sp. Leaf2]|uniref:ATP phosphoribosyltransferase regulatory subunit n=1 Tax=Novosphingobium sp. Leaf2 TaxID=1735670 RepID=UPI0006FF51A3|nr:ATP phosphoribosyltransferase regulatory subunit [Novosphingobium sp. Leaf2]KQM19271.1 ATP phosphoribosyltransferase regulatory subunit [Novosphingobium sp. Leaf2]
MHENDRDLLPEGLGDRLPQQAFASQTVRRAAHDVLASYGYARVETPVLEFEKALASRMAGVEVRRMFRFIDPASLRLLALRSDITAQVARIAATGLSQAPRPLRLSYSGQVVTVKGDGLDPARERLQLGAELIGADSTQAAAEIVELAIETLHAAGATGVSIDFTMPDLVDTLSAEALPLPAAHIAAVRRMLDAKDAGGLVDAGGEAYLPLLYAVGPFDHAIEQLAAFDASGALASRIAGLRTIAARVAGKARLTLDPSERHGFEYQTWFGFTIYADGVAGAMGRGGTYAILGQSGRETEPATGFSLYPDPLIDTLPGTGGEERRLFLPLGHDRTLAARQRAVGWVTVSALSESDDPLSLGCSHRLENGQAVPILV